MIRSRPSIAAIVATLVLAANWRVVWADECLNDTRSSQPRQTNGLAHVLGKTVLVSCSPSLVPLLDIFSSSHQSGLLDGLSRDSVPGGSDPDQSVRLNPLPLPKVARRLIHSDDTSGIVDLAYSSDGKNILLLQREGEKLRLFRWDSRTGTMSDAVTLPMIVDPPTLTRPARMAVSSRGLIAFAAAHRVVTEGRKRREISVSIINERSDRELRSFHVGARGFVDCLAFRFSPNGKWLAIGTDIYDTQSWTRVKLLDALSRGLHCNIDFHPTEDRVLLVHPSRGLIAVELGSGRRSAPSVINREAARRALGNRRRYAAAAWLPDRDAIVVGSTGRLVIASSEPQEDRGPWHLDYRPTFSDVKVSAGGRWVAALANRTFESDRYVVIYDTQTGRFHRHPAMRFLFHPTQDRLAALTVKKAKDGRTVWYASELDLTRAFHAD